MAGSQTCYRLKGEVRTDYILETPYSRSSDTSLFLARAQIGLDARTSTDFGKLRTYTLINAYLLPGGSNLFTVDSAYIQFGGLLAGYTSGQFGLYNSEYGNTLIQPYFGYSGSSNLLAYKWELPQDLSLSVSLEDPVASRALLFNEEINRPVSAGGSRLPDMIGNLRMDKSWGEAAVFGALHQVRYPVPGIQGNSPGYAVGSAVGIKFPLLEGAHLVAEGIYAHGASAYLGWQQRDAVFDSRTGMSDAGHGWAGTAEFGIDLTKRWKLNGIGSYLDYRAADINSHLSVSTADISAWTAGSNLTYEVTRGFSVAGEMYYSSYNYKFDGKIGKGDDTQGWAGTLRLQRRF